MLTLPLAVALALFLAGSPGPAAPTGGSLQSQSARGKELMAAERYAEAIPVYRALVQALPNNPGLQLNLGMALHLDGQDDASIPHLQEALRLQPQALPAALFLGAAQLRAGRPQAAEVPLQAAVTLDPRNPQARALLADALVALSDFGRAEPHQRRLTELDPGGTRAWFGLGTTYEALAAQAFDDLVKQDPEGAYTAALAARARREQGQEEIAFQLYREAIARAPALRGLHAAVAEIYRGTGHAEWAAVEEERERALPRLTCETASAECALMRGEPRMALNAVARSTSAETLFWRVRAYNALAEQAFAALSRLRPSPESHERAARMHGRGRRHAAAAAEWRQAVALAPDDLELRLELAASLREGRDLSAAHEVLEEILRRAPEEPSASHLMGDVLLEQQDPQRAIPFLEKAARGEEADPHAHATLGRAYALVGRPGEAIPRLKQALATDVDGSLRYQLARAYQATGQVELARATLREYEEIRQGAAALRDAANPGITPP